MTDDLVKLGNGLADTLTRAAEEQVTRAQTMMDQTKALVEIILTQVNAQAKSNEEMNARFRQVGDIMLNAHRILNGRPADRLDGLAATAPSGDLAKLHTLARNYGGHVDPPGTGPTAPGSTIDAKRANDPATRAPDFARQRELPRAVAAGDPFAGRDDPGADRKHPAGTDDRSF